MGQLHIRNVQQAHMGAVFRCPHALCYVLFAMKLNYASIEIMLRCKGKELILAKKSYFAIILAILDCGKNVFSRCDTTILNILTFRNV